MTINEFKRAQVLVDKIEILQTQVGNLTDIINNTSDPVKVNIRGIEFSLPANRLITIATNRRNELQAELQTLLNQLSAL